mmetsp:Transcript_78066/g.141960  ORF Transcript_78066/g.141960 Transcript_78066/m.141960 type:complete len:421 (-) Transcript_78066:155-1417(-)
MTLVLPLLAVLTCIVYGEFDHASQGSATDTNIFLQTRVDMKAETQPQYSTSDEGNGEGGGDDVSEDSAGAGEIQIQTGGGESSHDYIHEDSGAAREKHMMNYAGGFGAEIHDLQAFGHAAKRKYLLAPSGRTIPDKLLFNHRVNLLKEPNDDLPRAQNVQKIMKFFPDIQEVEFLDDEGCHALIEQVHSKELADFYDVELEGMYKSDVCRLAQLLKHGGYYMDTDLDVMLDMRKILPKDVAFASVIALPWKGYKDPWEMFQAFLAAAPDHPVIRTALDKCLDFYAWSDPDLASEMGGDMQGTRLMRLVFEDWMKHEMEPGLQEKRDEYDFRYSYLFEEDWLDPQKLDPKKFTGIQARSSKEQCNVGVLDRSQQKILAYSHIVHSSNCKHSANMTAKHTKSAALKQTKHCNPATEDCPMEP